ncbi:MAG TPA: hypothetical protein VGX25_08380 [Actinophytocola sp.]|uniref:hypothetical protein n=1 Tax=Actinophytocola sp. TaxID=1872138 RepID=UPI002DDD054B|nr:hypothetical protein [Actinophytocola sp.]HEV2779405.1 hypothetical protein [Actinophytocola sp.]
MSNTNARPAGTTTTQQVRTAVKAGGVKINHSEAVVVRTSVKAGGTQLNHSETVVGRTSVKAGGIDPNHNEALVVRTAIKAGEGRIITNHNESFAG